MNGKAPRRPRESKKEAVCLCSRGGMRKCPRSVSNLSEGGQATFSRRGKARQSRSSHRRAGLQLHGPIRGYVAEKKEEERKEKIQSRAWFLEGRITLLPLSYMTPPSYTRPTLQPPPTHTHTHKVAVRVWVCESFRSAHRRHLLLLLPCLSVSAWAGAV